MSYPEYIASNAWRKLRRKALARDRTCVGCDAPDGLQVHHRAYPPQGKWHLDRLDKLTTLCGPCHDLLTNRDRAARYAAQAPTVVPDYVSHTPRQPSSVRAATHTPPPDYRSVAPRHPRSAPAPPASPQPGDYRSPRSQ